MDGKNVSFICARDSLGELATQLVHKDLAFISEMFVSRRSP